MKRLQVYMPEELLNDLRLYAESRNIPLAEALREAGREFNNKPIVKKQIKQLKIKKAKTSQNPFLDMVGILGKGPIDASMTVDDIYD